MAAIPAAVAPVVLALSGTAVAGAATPNAAWKPEAPSYDVYEKDDIPITVTNLDGRTTTILRANVGVPAPKGSADPITGRAPAPVRGQQFPVLVTQTPYRKDGGLFGVDPYFVSRGYAYVIVDVRGTGSSQGNWDSFGAEEQHDGPQVVRWAAHQPWANGKVGLTGASYLAINQREDSITQTASSSRRIHAYTIQTSSNGTSWSTLKSGNLPNARGAQFIDIGATARYVRLVVNSMYSSSKTLRIDELWLGSSYA